MDDLGQRIIHDERRVRDLRSEAVGLEQRARRLREDADEVERLLELARRQWRGKE